MMRIITALLLALALSGGSSLAFAEEVASPAATDTTEIAPNAPERYVVVRGDTLWGIAGKFLQEPWRWPDIWRMNQEQIKNPHRIYPGDVIVLEKDANGRPQLRVLQDEKLSPTIYAENNRESIPSVPANIIEPFISEPLIVDDETIKDSARIVAVQQDRFYLGKGDTAFVAGASGRPQQELWQIYRPGSPIKDPETKKELGLEAFYLGTARQQTPGEAGTFEITSAKQEIARGDWLIPAEKPALVNYVPHKPTRATRARIVSIYGGVGVGGQHSVITINKGSTDGLEVGHVLALFRNRVETFRNTESDKRESVRVPNVRYGLIFVFRTFERLSYALVLEANGTVDVNDYARNP